MPQHSRPEKPDESRLELKVQRLPWRRDQEDWRDLPVSIGMWDESDRHATLADLPTGTSAYLATLRDSTRQILWEPGDSTERSAAGRVFGALLRQLYDGRRWRLAVLPSGGGPMGEELECLYGPMRKKSWATRRKLQNRYLMSIGLSYAFAIEPEEVGIHDPQCVGQDWWWLRKPIVDDVLGLSWWFGCEGYVVPRSRPQALREGLAQTEGRQVLRDLVQTCHLCFAHAGEGESMLILSRHLPRAQVGAARESLDVCRAVRLASRAARFTEWGPVDTAGRWWKKK